MDTLFRFIVTVYGLSLTATVVAAIAAPSIALYLGIPALIVSGWVFFGHLVTLDDDYPGGWSNPDRDKEYWMRSLKHLLIKLLAFVTTGMVVMLTSRSG